MLVALLAAPAWCDLSVDECRALAQQHAEAPLDGIEPTAETLGGSTIVTFMLRQPAIRYRVNATEGYFLDWCRLDSPPRVEGTLTEDQATALARAVAARESGAAAEALTWAVDLRPDGSAFVQSTGPKLGDPPRSGMSLRVMMYLLPDGTVLSYQQMLPAKEDSVPALVAVSGDEARRIALDDLGLDGFHVDTADLSQRRGQVEWHVQVSDRQPSDPPQRAPRAALYTIDATDGTILERSLSSSAGWPERGYPTSKQPRPLPYWLRRHGRFAAAAAGVAGLCFGALMVARVARRRART